METFRRLLTDRKGATAMEYGVIAALIATAIIAAVISLQGSISDVFARVAAAF